MAEPATLLAVVAAVSTALVLGALAGNLLLAGAPEAALASIEGAAPG